MFWILTLAFSSVFGLCIAVLLLLMVLPSKVQYIETIVVNAPVKKVYDAIRFQSQLMQWSAWQAETNSQCKIQNNDGQIGVRTVYLAKGQEFGYQEIIELVENEKVSFYLTSKAPFEQDTKLHFLLKKLDHNSTEVNLWFDNTLKKPSLLLPYIFGIIKWTHQMHLKDLAGLKKYAETMEVVAV